jgi:methanogenic corrinoid protein MtbC1
MASLRPQVEDEALDCIPKPRKPGSSENMRQAFRRGRKKQPRDNKEEFECIEFDLEAEIIPRLMLAHDVPTPQKTEPTLNSGTPGNPAHIRELSALAIDAEIEAVVGYIESVVSETTPLDRVLVEVVGGAARHMGELWESDDLDFMEVTIGVSRLQQAIRLVSNNHLPCSSSNADRVRTAAFVPTQGEQHTFGLLMVGEAFRCAGWDVCGAGELDSNAILKIASSERIDLVGFSLASDSQLDQLSSEIDTLRSASCSTDLVIIVGGTIFLEHPALWKSTGADAMAPDAIEALRIGDRLVKGGQMRLP